MTKWDDLWVGDEPDTAGYDPESWYALVKDEGDKLQEKLEELRTVVDDEVYVLK